MGLVVQGGKQKVTKVVPLLKMAGKHEGVPNTATVITRNKCTVLHVQTANSLCIADYQ